MAALEDLMSRLGIDVTIDPDKADVDEDVCPVCGGLGMVYPELDMDDPQYGKVVECPEGCEAVQKKRHDVHERTLGRIERLMARESAPFDVTMADFVEVSRDGDRRIGRGAATEYLREMALSVDGVRKRSLVFVGETGTGKTFLASAITNELRLMGVVVWYMRFGEMLQRVQACYDRESDVKPLDVIGALQRVPVLVLDDVGMHRNSEDRMDIVEAVVDYRYTRDLPCVMTTNLSQGELRDQWGARTASRLVHMAHWFRIDGTIRDTRPEWNT